MCGTTGSCDRAANNRPNNDDFVTPLLARQVADDVLLTIVNLHPEEMLTQTHIAERCGHTPEFLKACAQAAVKGYTDCLGRSRFGNEGDLIARMNVEKGVNTAERATRRNVYRMQSMRKVHHRKQEKCTRGGTDMNETRDKRKRILMPYYPKCGAL